MKKHIKGFTLVELLAVIIVLAIILAIAIPRISNIIESAERSSFVSSTKLLIKAVQTKLLEDETFDVTTINKSNMKTLFNIPDDNYSYVSFRYDSNNKLFAYIEGQGEWDNLTSYGSYEEIDVTDSIVRDGLVLYLDAGNKTSYPGAGTTWYDLSGNGNNGTLINSPLYNDEVGYFNFNGLDNYALIQSKLFTTQQFSLGYWINVSLFNKNYVGGAVSNNKYSVFGTTQSYQGYSNTFSTAVQTAANSNALGTIQKSGFSTDVWYYYFTVYDGNQGSNSARLKLYINGSKETLVYDSPVPSLPYNNNTYTSIGYGGYGYSADKISGVVYYDRALSDDEIKRNFNALRHRYGI